MIGAPGGTDYGVDETTLKDTPVPEGWVRPGQWLDEFRRRFPSLAPPSGDPVDLGESGVVTLKSEPGLFW